MNFKTIFAFFGIILSMAVSAYSQPTNPSLSAAVEPDKHQSGAWAQVIVYDEFGNQYPNPSYLRGRRRYYQRPEKPIKITPELAENQ